MNLNRSFLLGAAFAFFGLLLFAEGLLGWVLASGAWYAHVDPAGDMTSRAELEERIQATPVTGKRSLLVYGDSVLGATALLEHRLPDARNRTLHHHLKEGFRAKGSEILDLGADGLLLPDIEALQRKVGPFSPKNVLLILNFRMFAEEFATGPKALSRKFLRQDMSPAVRDLVGEAEASDREALWGNRLYEGFCEHWILFREAQVLKSLWFAPSRKDFFERQLERVTGHDDAQADIREETLKQRTAGYYKDQIWRTDSLPFRSLQETLNDLMEGAPDVTVVLTPQNAAFLEGILDLPESKKNRRILKDLLEPYKQKGLRYLDWSDHYPKELFLDHCHLTPEGNERYAKDLLEQLQGGRP
jgi:hypothetical protein